MNFRELSTSSVLPAADDPQRVALAKVLDEYLASLERGEWPSAEELITRHPDLAEELPAYLEGLQLLHSATSDSAVSGLMLDALPARDDAGGKGPVNKRIGDFELVNLVGRGGMGVVYEAWQLSLNRRVALKMLPFAAMLDERQTARFTTEAQAAAGLHHQNIVPVYAVGQERGVHFYAMQFIDGHTLAEAITEMRDASDAPESADAVALGGQPDAKSATSSSHRHERPPSSLGSMRGQAFFRAAARIAAEAADALDHAHRYGVVHRDVKPANLMVDRSGKLWVTDFGLARVQSEMSMTMPGDLVGSLRYMSPEQARGRGDLIDCRTDVYGLGATLYELLTLSAAHHGDDPEMLLHRVFNHEPTTPRKINSAIPADLENIVLKAIEKSREDRYPTAQAMAEDLRRFLDGKPTEARRPSPIDRLVRWASRRRGVAIAAASALLAVTAVSVASAVWVAAAGRETSEALLQAQASQALAEAHFEQARSVVDHYGGELADRLGGVPGAEEIRSELLSDTLQYYQKFLKTTPADSTLASDLAATYFKSGAVSERLGDASAAHGFYTKAVAQWRTLRQSAPGRSDADLEFGVGLGALARVKGSLDQDADAELLFDEAVAVLSELAPPQTADPEIVNAFSEVLSNYGLLLRRDERVEAAAEKIRHAVALLEAAVAAAPENERLIRNLAVANSNLSETLRGIAPSEAMAASRDARLAMRRLVESHPENDDYAVDLAMTYNNLAALQGASGDWRSAARGYQQASDLLIEQVRRNPTLPQRRRELAISESNLGLAYARTTRHSESEQAFDVAERMLQGLIRDFPARISYQTALAALWNNHGVALQATGHDTEALEAFAQAVEVQEKLAEKGGITLAQASLLSRQYENYLELLREANRDAERRRVELRLRQLHQAIETPPAPAKQLSTSSP